MSHNNSINPALTFSQHHQLTVFTIGFFAMGVAGLFLIDGLSQFSGSDLSKSLLISCGILFQLTESVCFISAAMLPSSHNKWRLSLLVGGVALFLFSVFVMTLAQKSAMEVGELTAQAQDEKAMFLQEQISSIDSVIQGYQANAEKQSQSIYAQSRALGQDSLNRSSELLLQKQKLSSELYALREQRQLTSMDFFTRLESITGWQAESTEFGFLSTRSLLLELVGILLMSFAAYLKAQSRSPEPGTEPVSVEDADVNPGPPLPKPGDVFMEPVVFEDEPNFDEVEPDDHSVMSFSVRRKITPPGRGKSYSDADFQSLVDKTLYLHHNSQINDLATRTIMKGLKEHFSVSLGTNVAERVRSRANQILARKKNLETLAD